MTAFDSAETTEFTISDMINKATSSDAKVIEFSTFQKLKEPASSNLQLKMADFINLLTTHTVRPDKDGKLFSPALFNSSRSNKNFIQATGICLDFDEGHPTIEKVLAIFPETLTAYYTTHSHTPENPRFRVVMPLSRPVNEEEYDWLVKGIRSVIPADLMECIDTSCFDRARAHYLPSCPEMNKNNKFSGQQDGEPLNVTYYIRLGKITELQGISEKSEHLQSKTIVSALPQQIPSAFVYVNPKNSESVNLKTWAASNPGFDIVTAVNPIYRNGIVKDGKQHIICPFHEQHTDKSDDMATYVVNASPPEYASFNVHCCHSHCVGRDRLEFIKAMLEGGWISTNLLLNNSELSLKSLLTRPKFFNYRSDELSNLLIKQYLQPTEFQAFLHLMHVACSAYDATLPDDDWNLARILGFSEQQWDKVKATLLRSGWLIADGGRLFNKLYLREYQIAQHEFLSRSVGGKIGGQQTQQKRRETRNSYLKG
jgi:hypothetical protein